jgi:NTE family protein
MMAKTFQRMSRPPQAAGRFRTRGVLAVALLAALHAAGAADAPSVPREQAARPRIGLVLGGGGAKGAAHIGVIKVLEELRIPIDCIAGTSMGSIVGAAYATGLSANELEKVITAVNWKEVLQSAPRQDVPVHRKYLDFIFTLGFEVGIKDGKLVLPGGIVPTQQVEALFRRIVAGARQTSNFDQLPIPFRAVATDLESGQMAVFDKGDLTIAMRASMAVPGAFAPVDYNGRLYVDGMLVRNLPVDVARQTCADVVIAVPVGNPALKREDLGGAFSILGQAMNIAIESNEKAQLATLTAKDVAVPVILPGIGSGDFHKVPEAIPLGEEAARKVAAALSRYSLPPREYAAWREQVGNVAGAPKIKLDEVRLSGFKVTNPEVMKTFIATKPGDTYDPTKADADTTELVARRDFTSVNYQLTTEGPRNVLTYNATEKPWGPNYLLFDLNLSTDFKGDTAFGLRMDYEKRWLNALGGEWRTSFQVGRPNIFNSEFYQPLDLHQRFFVAPSVYATQTLQYIYFGNTTVAQFDTRRYGLKLDGGIALGSWGEFRLGLVRGGLDATNKVANPTIPEPNYNSVGGATMRFVYDQLDKRLFATAGAYAQVTGFSSQSGLGGEQTYHTLNVNMSKVWSHGRNVWIAGLKGGTDFNTNPQFYDQFTAGGLFNFSGYRNGQLIGREYALGAVTYRRRIADLSETFGTGIYAGASLETGNVFQRLDGTTARGTLTGGSLYLAVDSKFGPVYVAYGQSQGGHSAFYLYIGSSLEAVRP